MDIFAIISTLSWFLLLLTGWISLGVPSVKDEGDHKANIFWLINHVNWNNAYGNPIDIHYVIFYMIIIVTLLLITAGFLVYIYSIFISKNEEVQNGMLGEKSKFHFFPLLCISFLFIIGESLKKIDDSYGYFGHYTGIYFKIKKAHCAFNLIFNIITLPSLIFIYLNSKISKPLYVNLIIKKGVYSCFIALLVYNFCYVITITDVINNKSKFYYQIEYDFKWLKRSGYIFSIIIGVVNSFLSIFLKDIMIGIINTFMYLGMIINFFKIEKNDRKYMFDNDGIGGMHIIMMLGSICSIVFIVIKFKNSLLE